MSPLGNGGVAVSFHYAASNTLGGTTTTARNLLCASTNQGVFIYYANNEVVQGNYIGVGADGATPLGNGTGSHTQAGIYCRARQREQHNWRHGGRTPGNVISANGNDGVQFYGSGADYNTVQGNLIGTTADGLSASVMKRQRTVFDLRPAV